MSEIRTARFAAPDEAREKYDAIIPAYQAAFAAEPWYEVSKCGGCSSGYSRQNPGDICQACGSATGDEAYTEQELTEKFNAIGETRPTCWYIEETPAGLALAAVAWTANPAQIAAEKYPGSLEMAAWLKQKYAPTAASDSEIVWLDEVFADRQISRRNNLVNFCPMIYGFSDRLDQTKVAYRTIAPAMTRVAMRDFGDDAIIDKAKSDVPDWRNFVSIDLSR